MNRSTFLVISSISLLCGCASSPEHGAQDCSSVEPRRWMTGVCERADIRLSIAARLDEPSRAKVASDCSTISPTQWLPGIWKMGETTLTITRSGDDFQWKMNRPKGQISQTWGEKETAQGAGRVASIDGCKVSLKGAYTAYGGIGATGRNPIGWQMDYSVELIAPDVLAGDGIGYGQKRFRVLFTQQRQHAPV